MKKWFRFDCNAYNIFGVLLAAVIFGVIGWQIYERPLAHYDPADSAVLMGLEGWNAKNLGTLHKASCSGVSIGDHRFLTAAHCVDVVGAPADILIGEIWYPAITVAVGDYDRGADWALVYVGDRNAPAVPAARIRATPLAVGEEVHAIGWPRPYNFKTETWGRVSAPNVFRPAPEFGGTPLGQTPSPDAGPYMQSDLNIAPGSSGGPLFDWSGALVGINVAVTYYNIDDFSRMGGQKIPTGQSMAVPMTVICAEAIEC